MRTARLKRDNESSRQPQIGADGRETEVANKTDTELARRELTVLAALTSGYTLDGRNVQSLSE